MHSRAIHLQARPQKDGITSLPRPVCLVFFCSPDDDIRTDRSIFLYIRYLARMVHRIRSCE